MTIMVCFAGDFGRSCVYHADDDLVQTDQGLKRADALVGSAQARVTVGGVTYTACYGGSYMNGWAVRHQAGAPGERRLLNVRAPESAREVASGLRLTAVPAEREVVVTFGTEANGQPAAPTADEIVAALAASPAGDYVSATPGAHAAREDVGVMDGGADDGDLYRFELDRHSRRISTARRVL